MTWHTNELTPNNLLIQDGNRVVGSIVKKDDRWFVEIPWDDGDIKHDAPDYLHVLSFIEGVEKAWRAAGVVE